MKCNSCNAEWTTQSAAVMEKCPFCGASLIPEIKPAEKAVSNAALLEYLEAAIDAENAVYACEKVILTLEQKKDGIRRSIVPNEPSRDQFVSGVPMSKIWHIKNHFTDYGWLYLFVSGILGAVIGYRSGGIGMLIVGFFVAGLIMTAIMDIVEKRMKKSVNDKAKLQDDARYDTAMARYHEQMDGYNQAVRLENAAIAKLDQGISEMQNRKESAAAILRQIYAQNLIHPNFRKLVAVTQIHDYLEMRLCDQLEGPTGAYAEYMKDVRANRICDSIIQLEDTMKKGFSQMYAAQASIMRAINATNASVSEMNTSLSSSLNSMQQSILSAQRAVSGKIQEHMTEANQHLDSISRTLNNAAYNEYIALKETSASAYLRKIS